MRKTSVELPERRLPAGGREGGPCSLVLGWQDLAKGPRLGLGGRCREGSLCRGVLACYCISRGCGRNFFGKETWKNLERDPGLVLESSKRGPAVCGGSDLWRGMVFIILLMCRLVDTFKKHVGRFLQGASSAGMS